MIRFGGILIALAMGNLVGANAYRQGGWTAVLGCVLLTAGLGFIVAAVGASRGE